MFQDGSEAVIPEPDVGEGWELDCSGWGGNWKSGKRKRDILKNLDCTHFEGEAVVREWATRIRKEGCRVDVQRWTRTIKPEPVEYYPAFENYPLLLGPPLEKRGWLQENATHVRHGHRILARWRRI